MNNNCLSWLPRVILPWYEMNKRELPWRVDCEPYHVWVSEIMLQQTRVEAVKAYYTRFIKELPNIQALAQVDDEHLYKLWEGLGYYSRVKNMKKAAIEICQKYDGKFPKAYDQILSLPGIGTYTAGAISSIAFNCAVPAIDGNVLRVFARLTDDATPVDSPAFKKLVHHCLSAIYPPEAGDFTQALMELGATICGPNRKPGCDRCPCRPFCRSCKNGTQTALPVKLPKRSRNKEELTVFLFSCDGEYAIEKRPPSGLLANLWQFPNVSGKLELDEALLLLQNRGISVHNVTRKVERTHIFTHIAWHMTGIYAELSEKSDRFVWMPLDEIRASTAIPTAFRQFMEEI